MAILCNRCYPGPEYMTLVKVDEDGYRYYECSGGHSLVLGPE